VVLGVDQRHLAVDHASGNGILLENHAITIDRQRVTSSRVITGYRRQGRGCVVCARKGPSVGLRAEGGTHGGVTGGSKRHRRALCDRPRDRARSACRPVRVGARSVHTGAGGESCNREIYFAGYCGTCDRGLPETNIGATVILVPRSVVEVAVFTDDGDTIDRVSRVWARRDRVLRGPNSAGRLVCLCRWRLVATAATTAPPRQ